MHLDNPSDGSLTPRPALEIRAIHELRGPNLWTNRPALELWIDLGSLKDTASTEIPGFNERLIEWLPTMIEHRCSVGERGGFFQRLWSGTYPAHILEHVALELQTLAGTNVGYGRARAMQEDGVYRVVVRYEDAALGRAAVAEARKLILAAYAGNDFDVAAAVTRIRALAQPSALDLTLQALIAAARVRGIPTMSLGPTGLLIIGQGIHQHRIRGTATGTTPAVAEEIAEDRLIYRPLLEAIGVPVPQGERVHSAEEAWEAADSLGVPVIVKPLYRDQGPGISAPLTARPEIEAAYGAAAEVSSYIAVERFVPGNRFELLILDGRMIAAAEVPDQASLQKPVLDVTDRVHPEVAARAIESARMVGLDVAVAVVVAPGIEQPLEEQGGVVRSIEARPDLSAFLAPRASHPRPVAELLLERAFPNGGAGRIPIVAIAGGPERQVVGRLTEWLLQAIRGSGVGHASGNGVRIDGRPIHGRFTRAFDATRSLLMNPQLETAVIEIGRRDVLLDGLAFDRCAVGMVTGLDEHAALPLPGWGFEHPEENLVRAERCVVEVVEDKGTSIFRAETPRIVAMAERSRGHVLVVGSSAQDPILAAHRAAGGWCVSYDKGTSDSIVLAQGDIIEKRLNCRPDLLANVRRWIHDVAVEVSLDPRETLLLAVSAVWALGEATDAIGQALDKIKA